MMTMILLLTEAPPATWGDLLPGALLLTAASVLAVALAWRGSR